MLIALHIFLGIIIFDCLLVGHLYFRKEDYMKDYLYLLELIEDW